MYKLAVLRHPRCAKHLTHPLCAARSAWLLILLLPLLLVVFVFCIFFVRGGDAGCSGAVTKPDSLGFKVTNIFGSELRFCMQDWVVHTQTLPALPPFVPNISSVFCFCRFRFRRTWMCGGRNPIFFPSAPVFSHPLPPLAVLLTLALFFCVVLVVVLLSFFTFGVLVSSYPNLLVSLLSASQTS